MKLIPIMSIIEGVKHYCIRLDEYIICIDRDIKTCWLEVNVDKSNNLIDINLLDRYASFYKRVTKEEFILSNNVKVFDKNNRKIENSSLLQLVIKKLKAQLMIEKLSK